MLNQSMTRCRTSSLTVVLLLSFLLVFNGMALGERSRELFFQPHKLNIRRKCPNFILFFIIIF